VTAVEHVVGTIKSHYPGLYVSLLLRGYKCSHLDEAQRILESVQPTARSFVKKLSLSLDDDDDDEDGDDGGGEDNE